MRPQKAYLTPNIIRLGVTIMSQTNDTFQQQFLFLNN